MKELFMIIWLFPILFMIHDFEEIIIIKSWQQKNKEYIENRLQKFVPFNFKASTAAFSIGVAEEFVIISIVTIISYVFNNYIAWFSLFIAFALHLFFHAIMWMIFKKYVPGVVTSVIFIPLCCFIVYRVNMLLHYNITTLLFSILIATLIMIVNIYFLHKVMEKFDFWLEKYSSNSI